MKRLIVFCIDHQGLSHATLSHLKTFKQRGVERSENNKQCNNMKKGTDRKRKKMTPQVDVPLRTNADKV